VQLGRMVCNSHRELTSLGSCSTRDGPRPPACRHPDRALQPHEPWPGRSSSAVPRHRPSPLRPTAALLQNGLALRLGRQSCVSMHPLTTQNTTHPGSTAAVWLRHVAVRGQRPAWGRTPRVLGLPWPHGHSLDRGNPSAH